MSTKKQTKLVSKQEALELISAQLRKPDLNPSQFAKLLKLQSQLSGWKPTQQPDPDGEPSIDQLVAAVEKKRRAAAQQKTTSPTEETL
jgi:hypothetical protein